MQTTIDGLLDRRVVIEQPANGFRVAVDTVLLAAAVPARAGQRVLELGCGVGGAMLCLACRVAGLEGVGVEIQPDLLRLCLANLQRNEFAAGMRAQSGDVTKLALGGDYDHVLMNPPYHEEGRHDVSAHQGRSIANTEKDGDLALWLRAARGAVGPEGVLTLIHRADRQGEIVGLLQDGWGAVEVLPVLPKAGAEAKRVIMRARLTGGGMTECRPLILHAPQGGYSDAAKAVLRHAAALEFMPQSF
jgi:tRNA1(Val) A37 N6-methylase TrmN6